MKPDNTLAINARKKLTDWFLSPLGQAALASERNQLATILPDLFGYYILQYGGAAELNYIASSRVQNKTVLFLDETELNQNTLGIKSTAEALPIANASIDVIVLPHILEYAQNQHQLLREAARVLIDDGYIVIIGINPISLWGLWYLPLRWWGDAPWHGQLLSISRIKDWLSLLNFETTRVQQFFFLPPLQRDQLLKKLHPLERLGAHCWQPLGGLYIIVAKKRTIPLNIVNLKWRAKTNTIGVGAIKPTV